MNSLQYINFTTENIITWGVGLSIVIMLLISLTPTIKYVFHERQLAQAIKLLGIKSMRNVIISDGLGGSTFIDYLVLQPGCILVVMLKRYRGTIFGGDNIDLWTQLIGKRSFKFPNPIRQNELATHSVRNIVAPVLTSGMVVFHGSCDFPKGKPEQVRLVTEIISNSSKDNRATNTQTEDAWNQLQQAVEEHKPEHGYAKSYFRSQYDVQQLVLSGLFLLMLVGWLYLRVFLLV